MNLISNKTQVKKKKKVSLPFPCNLDQFPEEKLWYETKIIRYYYYCCYSCYFYFAISIIIITTTFILLSVRKCVIAPFSAKVHIRVILPLQVASTLCAV